MAGMTVRPRTFVQVGAVLVAGLALSAGVAHAQPAALASVPAGLPVGDSSSPATCFHFENPGIGVYRRVGDMSAPDPCPVGRR
jgi:hypothetical protein